MTVTVLRGGRVHTPADPDATAMALTDGVISWIGGEHGISTAGVPDRVVDLQGALVLPGFVDAHVHTTDAGLALTGLDLTGARSLRHCLRLIEDFAGQHPAAAVLWGHGWDETDWPENRPPTRTEIDQAVGFRPAYLSRIDVHSALVSTALMTGRATAEMFNLAGYHPDRPPTRAAHHAARAAAKRLLDPVQRAAAQRRFLAHAAAQGIVEVHECGFPDEQGLADLAALLAVDSGVSVLGYLAAPVTDAEQAKAIVAATGAHALGGDLSVDGAIGSRTAALKNPYRDDESTCGARYLTDVEITAHLLACVRAGIQPGFHAIGDDAVAAVAQGLRQAAEALGEHGTMAVAAVAPRIEHAEMADAESIAAFAATGAIASVQPLFDALWGGERGMYVQRLGADRAAPMNPFAALASAGVPLALGSDAPVTPADPWRAVQAAVHHRTPGSGVSPRAAFTAHTRGGHRAAGRGDRGIGTIAVGAVAHLAIVRAENLVRPGADPSVARWSTDPRSRVPLLPDLTRGVRLPETVATLVAGRVVFDTGLFD